ncbi:MAG: hypothetical protein DUD33_08360 [Coriobacteriaceae bacterium]|jgi:hypothetical protein|nr:hypothetical protein [Olsenella sp.]RRF89151.1 MAG: hypothetical protein DUD33_08360 [Coriobacteriaceae bacterium]
MADEKTMVMESGTENRKLFWGVMPEGKAYVRETSKGDLTEIMFDAAERETTVTFEPTDDYSLADVADTVEGHADDCFITDFEDALTLWGIPYTRDEKVIPLDA